MLRAALGRALLGSRTAMKMSVPVTQVRLSHGAVLTEEGLNHKYLCLFNKAGIDGWEVRKHMNDIMGHDWIPDPSVIIASLKACRRINDYAVAARWMEALEWKCNTWGKEYWPYYLQELRCTLDELGVNTAEELGHDKPELACQSAHD